MFSITDLKSGTKITLLGDPFMVVSYAHSKMGRGGAVAKTRLKNLRTGAVIDKTFQGSDKISDAEIIKKRATFLYNDQNSAFFMDSESYDQFSIPISVVGDQKNYLIENSPVDILYFNEEPINIELPIKLTLKVTSAPPGIKGNSSGTVTKKVTLETGATADVPLFIKENDKIVIDTRDGKYVERG